MNLERWRLFAEVAELGSLSRAAGLRKTSQSVISRQIAGLERECRGPLFHRTGRGVVLTDGGKRLLPRVKALLENADELTRAAKGDVSVPNGLVRVGVMPSIAHPLVTQLFRRTREQFPGIQLRIFDGSGGQLNEWLESGQIDIAILFRYGSDARPEDHALATIESYLIGPADDPLLRKGSVRFAQLHELPLVLPGTPNAMRIVLDQLARQHGVSLRVQIQCDALATQKNLAAEAGVYAILWRQAIAREMQEGRLRGAKIVDPGMTRTVTLCTSKRNPLTLACREVAKLIRMSVGDFTDPVSE